jgi:hypothetical protein
MGTAYTSLYNMDLDVYTIQNNINIGDTSAQIQLTSRFCNDQCHCHQIK